MVTAPPAGQASSGQPLARAAAAGLPGGTYTLHPIAERAPVTDEMLRDPDPEDWLIYRRTYDGWGHSPLDQINPDNVADLQLAWVWSMADGRNQPTPLVYDGVMYLANPGNVVQALDAVTGSLLWEYRRPLPEALRGANSRNLAIYDDKIYMGTRDAHVVALDARTGELVWESADGRLQRRLLELQRGRSSPGGGSSTASTAARGSCPTVASSPRTTRIPARSCGAA